MVQAPSHAHGGLLFGFGLCGALCHLTTPDVFDLLQQGHEGTSVGVVLGLAASKAGTSDVSVSKVLRLHVPAVLPAALSDLDVPPIVQVHHPPVSF